MHTLLSSRCTFTVRHCHACMCNDHLITITLYVWCGTCTGTPMCEISFSFFFLKYIFLCINCKQNHKLFGLQNRFLCSVAALYSSFSSLPTPKSCIFPSSDVEAESDHVTHGDQHSARANSHTSLAKRGEENKRLTSSRGRVIPTVDVKVTSFTVRKQQTS